MSNRVAEIVEEHTGYIAVAMEMMCWGSSHQSLDGKWYQWLTVSGVSFRVSNVETLDDWMTVNFFLVDVGAAAHHQMISS